MPPSDRAVVIFILVLLAALAAAAFVRGHGPTKGIGEVVTYSSEELRDLGVAEIVIEWRRWREAMHLTQAEAAAMVGVAPTTIMRVELGDSRPMARTVRKLRALMARWDESHRPARKPERRGQHNRGKPWGTNAPDHKARKAAKVRVCAA